MVHPDDGRYELAVQACSSDRWTGGCSDTGPTFPKAISALFMRGISAVRFAHRVARGSYPPPARHTTVRGILSPVLTERMPR